MASQPTWDIPTRLFHWALAIGIAVSWATYEFDALQWHIWNGYAVLVLVCFRLCWGFVGSIHSRFSSFVRPPTDTLRYIRGQWQHRAGHNPLGAWSVLALLTLVLVQATTGLFNSDELFYDGPFYHALDSSWTDRLGALHEQLFWVLLGFIILHLVAVAYYQWGKHQPLIQAMLNGGNDGEAPPVSVWRALLIVAVLSAGLAIAIRYAPKPVLPW